MTIPFREFIIVFMKPLVKSLNEQHRVGTLQRNMIIFAKYVEGKQNMVEIAREFGLTKQRVQQIIRNYEKLSEAGKDGKGDAPKTSANRKSPH